MANLLYTLTTDTGLYLKKTNDNTYIFQSSKKDMFVTEDRFLLEEIRSELDDCIEEDNYLSNDLTPKKVFINIYNKNDDTLTVVKHHYHSYGYHSDDDIYYSDYETKPIGGSNPYSQCVCCGVSVPQINMALNGHYKDCEYREKIEKEILSEEKKNYEETHKTEIKIYQTNSGLGYNQLAFLLKIKDNQYLVIDTVGINNGYSSYVIGSTVDFDYEQEIEVCENYKLEKSPLYGTFLFNHFLRTIYLSNF